MGLSSGDIFLIIGIVVVLIAVGLFYLNRWLSKRMTSQQELIQKTKQTATIYVIDKKKDYAKNVNLPKVAVEAMPKFSQLMKMYFVKAKIGTQILTLMCEKQVFNAIPVKKNASVELSGIYIVSVKGMKSKAELKAAAKAKKVKAKEAQAQEAKAKKAKS